MCEKMVWLFYEMILLIEKKRKIFVLIGFFFLLIFIDLVLFNLDFLVWMFSLYI